MEKKEAKKYVENVGELSSMLAYDILQKLTDLKVPPVEFIGVAVGLGSMLLALGIEEARKIELPCSNLITGSLNNTFRTMDTCLSVIACSPKEAGHEL